MDKLAPIKIVKLPVILELVPAARCTGHCCRSFPVSATLEQLAALAEHNPGDGEAAKILAMLVPLGPGSDPKTGALRELYTCKHHDPESGDCRTYDQRPRMCRDYPYGKECDHDDCTMR